MSTKLHVFFCAKKQQATNVMYCRNHLFFILLLIALAAHCQQAAPPKPDQYYMTLSHPVALGPYKGLPIRTHTAFDRKNLRFNFVSTTDGIGTSQIAYFNKTQYTVQVELQPTLRVNCTYKPMADDPTAFVAFHDEFAKYQHNFTANTVFVEHEGAVMQANHFRTQVQPDIQHDLFTCMEKNHPLYMVQSSKVLNFYINVHLFGYREQVTDDDFKLMVVDDLSTCTLV